MAKTVVALYDDARSANQAVSELVSNGFLREDISLMTQDAKGDYARELETYDETGAAQGAGIGAGLGAALGGFGGLLVGLGALTIPGIGPVLAAGPLAAAVSGLAGAGVGAVAGGVTGGILGALVDMGVPEERANYYAEGVRRGGTLLVVRTDDERTRDAVDIVNRHHPIDLNERSNQWRESGWSRFDPTAAAYSGTSGATFTDRSRSVNPATPLRPASSDRDYGTTVGSAAPALAHSYGMHDDSESREYGDDNSERMGMAGNTSDPTEAAAHHTESVVQGSSSEYMGMAGSTEASDYDTHPEVMGRDYGVSAGERRGRSIDDTGLPYSRPSDDYVAFDRYDANFRSYFASSPYATTYTYEEFVPAYRYGYDLSRQDRYRGHSWSDIEADARRDWELDHPGTWERFKDSVQHAWEEFKDAIS